MTHLGNNTEIACDMLHCTIKLNLTVNSISTKGPLRNYYGALKSQFPRKSRSGKLQKIDFLRT